LTFYPNPVKKELNITKQILKGLKYTHSKNLIHGDLNTTNIFFDSSKNIKIGDFGLSKKTTIKDLEMLTSSYGNLLYMPPENDNYICTKKTDIYSFGIIYFELIKSFSTTMERVKLIDNIKENNFININIDKYHINLLSLMLNKNYKSRPTIEQVYEMFKKIKKIDL